VRVSVKEVTMRRRDVIPVGPFILGFLGLVPFYAALLGGLFAPAPINGVAVTAFFTYGALILSFLGGTRWGFEVGSRPDGPSTVTLTFSIIPSLAALVAANSQYVSPMLGLGILMAGFLIMWAWDYGTSGGSTRRWPLWYRPLRTTLSLGAIIAIAIQIWITTGRPTL
jgi:hypothetical protein